MAFGKQLLMCSRKRLVPAVIRSRLIIMSISVALWNLPVCFTYVVSVDSRNLRRAPFLGGENEAGGWGLALC